MRVLRPERTSKPEEELSRVEASTGGMRRMVMSREGGGGRGGLRKGRLRAAGVERVKPVIARCGRWSRYMVSSNL